MFRGLLLLLAIDRSIMLRKVSGQWLKQVCTINSIFEGGTQTHIDRQSIREAGKTQADLDLDVIGDLDDAC